MSRVKNPFTDGVTLNTNSWYVKLLNWCWGVQPSEFKNLCPLFWAVIGTLVVSPFLIACTFFTNLYDRNLFWKHFCNVIGLIGKWTLALIYIFMAVILFAIAISACFSYSFWNDMFKYGLFTIGGIIVICLVVLYFTLMNDYDSTGQLKHIPYVAKTPYLATKGVCKGVGKPFQLFGTFISATYHKCCPFIHWK